MFWYEDCLGRGRQVNQETGKFISKIQKHIDIFEYFKMLSDAKLEFAQNENRPITVIIKKGGK